jgi:regulator of sirC expression with transglutaminase-like and TPR domain
VRGENWETLIDPFNRGVELSRYDCEQLMAQVYGRPTPLLPQYLEPVSKRAFLMRLLTNLQMIHLQNEEWPRAHTTIEHILQLRPDTQLTADLIRTRGLVYYKLKRWGDAEQDWLHYLTLAPNAPDASLIRQNIEALRTNLAKRN